MDGMAKGIEEMIRKRGVNLERFVPISHAPGSPITSERSTLKKACFSVKSVMRNKMEFSQTVTFPPALKAFQKVLPYGSRNANTTAKIIGKAKRIGSGE